jgi:hypothetical protein
MRGKLLAMGDCLDRSLRRLHGRFEIQTSAPKYLARAPAAPSDLTVVGNAVTGMMLSWNPPPTGAVDHYVIGARSTSENLYRQRVVSNATARSVTPAELGLNGGESFYISVASVDAKGHESLFAYPELRCDASACVVPAGALDITVRR